MKKRTKNQGNTRKTVENRAGFSARGKGNHRVFRPGEGNRRVFRPGAGNHRVFHPGEGNRRVFHPRSRKSPGFPPRCTRFSTQEQGTTGFSAQVHRVFHPGAPGFPPRRTENLSGGRVGWGETEDALTRLKTPEGSADFHQERQHVEQWATKFQRSG